MIAPAGRAGHRRSFWPATSICPRRISAISSVKAHPSRPPTIWPRRLPSRRTAKDFGQIESGQIAAESEGCQLPDDPQRFDLLAGIGLAYFLHLKNRALGDSPAERFAPITRLIEAKFWVDEIYQAFIVDPLRTLGEFFYGSTDGSSTCWLTWPVGSASSSAISLKFTTQRGYLQGYGAAMLLGLAAISS